MSTLEPIHPPSSIGSEPESTLGMLVEEAARQLSICNACRYCEGLCPVFPALERRPLLDVEDVSQLANLCHDCRACFDACMYTPPHDFGVNVPVALGAVREADYKRYVWPTTVPRALRGWMGVVTGAASSLAVIFAIALANVGWAGLARGPEGAESPYALIPYPEMLSLLTAATLFSLAVIVRAARQYWVAVGGAARHVSALAIGRAVWYAATLRYLRGGGANCHYPKDDKPSGERRRLHIMTVLGFSLCAVSTAAAAVLQDIVGQQPPYPWLSVPVVTGTVGGIGIIIGCTGLLVLKSHSSPVTSLRQMTVKDYGLLVALTFLALSGIATLLTRSTAAFGILFLIHLSTVVLAFASAPYSKMMHAVFRTLAIVQDNCESPRG